MLLLLDFFSFSVFLSLFSMLFFSLLVCQASFRWLVSFSDFFFVFKEITLTYLKKIHVESETEHIPMIVRCLRSFICSDSLDEKGAFDRLEKIIIWLFISFLCLQLNEYLQSERKKKLSSVQTSVALLQLLIRK